MEVIRNTSVEVKHTFHEVHHKRVSSHFLTYRPLPPKANVVDISQPYQQLYILSLTLTLTLNPTRQPSRGVGNVLGHRALARC